MRAIKSFDDAAAAIRDLQDWQSGFPKVNLDMHGLRIINAGDPLSPQDLVTQSALPVAKDTAIPIQPLYYTAVFSNAGVVHTGDLIPDFDFGWGREGQPLEVWVDAQGKPNGTSDSDALIINIELITYAVDGNSAVIKKILKDDLKLLSTDYIPLVDSSGSPVLDGSSNPIMECKKKSTRTMIIPLPKFPRYAKIRPIIVNGGNASTVSIGVVVQLFGGSQ